MTTAVQVIWLEHVNISSVLACLRYLVDEIEADRWSPDFRLLADILDYMAEFPEAMHHPKEEAFISAALLRRKPEAAPMLDKIRAEHETGAALLAGLRAKLVGYRDDPAAFAGFAEACRSYIQFERHHMAREERELLPLAAQELLDQDWAEIDRAFAQNEDPLFGAARKAHSTNCTATSWSARRAPWASARRRHPAEPYRPALLGITRRPVAAGRGGGRLGRNRGTARRRSPDRPGPGGPRGSAARAGIDPPSGSRACLRRPAP